LLSYSVSWTAVQGEDALSHEGEGTAVFGNFGKH
jgi:hypothetical protein